MKGWEAGVGVAAVEESYEDRFGDIEGEGIVNESGLIYCSMSRGSTQFEDASDFEVDCSVLTAAMFCVKLRDT